MSSRRHSRRLCLAAPILALAGCAHGFSCGETRCTPRQYCVVTEYAQGAAPPSGMPARTAETSQCADQEPQSPGLLCSPTRERYVQCTALIPARPPAR